MIHLIYMDYNKKVDLCRIALHLTACFLNDKNEQILKLFK